MKKTMKKIYIIMVSMLFLAACSTDLEQVPANKADANSITDYEPVLFAAYAYHAEAVAPMAIFGDFRADNCFFDETPFTDFDEFGNNNLTSSMTADFFQPFYAALYQSIISANNVITNSSNTKLVAEAKFVRALSYFKLIQVFGDVSVLLTSPTVEEIAATDLTRQDKTTVYNTVVIPDLQDARDGLSVSTAAAANGRATKYAAQGLLGKVYATMGNYSAAATELLAVINGTNANNIISTTPFTGIFGADNDLNDEVLFATQLSASVAYGNELYTVWYSGGNTKADPNEDAPIDQDLIDAFAASTGDLRTAVTLDDTLPISVKYTAGNGPDADWIELRIADVVLLYAEALNETGASAEDVLDILDPIRTRAGLAPLDHTVINTQVLVRQAILDERRLELACEGQRWFDLVRFNAAQPGILDTEMGETISSDYHLFPIPNTEVTSFDEIKQNPGY